VQTQQNFLSFLKSAFMDFFTRNEPIRVLQVSQLPAYTVALPLGIAAAVYVETPRSASPMKTIEKDPTFTVMLRLLKTSLAARDGKKRARTHARKITKKG